ncbi:Putative leucine-rich repeat domain superfamily [Septoria linicola]|uniref:Leucine-rich repeat domain superfamily n=1 Tax=Septoria linicola TaxID=215465 RepID=A0A9Q9B054_9PEZI|nr:putative leucine-rich repeat domain superfamily [Septoria linicola]USW55062.1 Putative leucine-rich repeat domain superfamily [Septoria linicola]
MDTQTAATTKPSTGIPRGPSKLPTTRLPAARPRPTSIAAPSALIRPSQKTIPQPTPTKPAAASATPTTSKLQKKPPTPGLARPTPVSSLKPPSGLQKPGTVRTNLTKPTLAKPSITSGLVPPRPRSGLQKRPVSTSRASSRPEDEENHDKLSSLDSFRSASRQGFSDEAESFDYVEPADAILERRSSRPSLSERTIESLQSVPSTPSDRRRSSFFNQPDSPMGPPPRPASAMSRNGRASSRPGTSDGSFSSRPLSTAGSAKVVPASARPATRTSTIATSRISSLPSNNTARRSISGGLTSKLQQARAESQRAVSPAKKPSALPNGSSIGLPNGTASKITSGNRTVATSRPAKPRPAVGNAFAPPTKRTPAGKPASSSADDAGSTEDSKRVVSNSSAALREQIAAAKAAARKQRESTTKRESSSSHATSTNGDAAAFEVDDHADPFGQAPRDEKHVLRYRVHNARMSGKLNVAAMGLKEMPEEVLKMYDATAMAESKVNWAEVVDLTKFIAADNEFEHIEDSVFSDRSNEELAADDEAEGNQFGGLELLDFHGNSLHALPLGLRRLERLTHLNVTHNKLENGVLDVITQISTLKELRIGNNNLTGNLPSSICSLTKLEVLDVQANRLLSLPEALSDLAGLRVLNVSGNQLTALPMDALVHIPLTELDASSNALIASLFPLGGPTGHPTLQSLNVANNSLAALTFSESLEMPKLKTLHLTNNQMTALPSVTSWTELITLHVGDNKVVDFPEGFTSLTKLRTANFTSNELRMLDPEICRMDSLDSLVLAANPLREKKFLTMNAADIKRDLRARLAPGSEAGTDDGEPTSPVTVVGAEESGSQWAVKGNGLLSLSGKDLAEDLDDDLSSFLNNNAVRQLQLQNSGITVIPPVLSLVQDLRTLDLSGNPLNAEYLADEIALPTLQELNLSKCRLTSLDLLMTFVQAPNLKTLNISANRLSGDLPALRTVFPQLTTLFATDNKIRSISADALRGLTTVNLASNDIESLPAEVGLLWDEGLRNFEVSSNAFRVPNYRLLDKGTEATLRWLRDRLPVGEDGRVDELE